MNSANLIGLAAGILTSVAMLPQLIKLIRDKKANDISPFAFSVLIAGLGLWIAYGFVRDDFPIIATNILSFIINLLLLILSIRFKPKN